MNMEINEKYGAIVIGVSAGGMKALGNIISRLPHNFTLPVIVVQHREKDSNSFLAEYLNTISNLQVKEAKLRESINTCTIYLAPAGYHLLIEDDKTFTFSVEPPIFARPSLCFLKVQHVYGERLIGVILTGANSDGAKGLKN
jgi:two-component system chemotaxis response regulator CheB